MIKDVRAVEWNAGTKRRPNLHWGVQVMRVGSVKWEFVDLKTLSRKPKNHSRLKVQK